MHRIGQHPILIGKILQSLFATKVTVNLMRKWHHTELYRLTKSEDKLLGLLKSIDAHTIKVARQHYALQTPADGANLAKALVHSMIGKPVHWPSAIELADVGKHKATYLQLVNAMVDPHEDLADEDDASGNAWVLWEGAAAFGFPQPLPVLQNDMLLEP